MCAHPLMSKDFATSLAKVRVVITPFAAEVCRVWLPAHKARKDFWPIEIDLLHHAVIDLRTIRVLDLGWGWLDGHL